MVIRLEPELEAALNQAALRRGIAASCSYLMRSGSVFWIRRAGGFPR